MRKKTISVQEIIEFKALFFNAFELGKDSISALLKKDFSNADEFFFFVAFYFFGRDQLVTKNDVQEEGLKDLFTRGKYGSHKKVAKALLLMRDGKTEEAKVIVENVWHVLKGGADFLLSPKSLLLIYCLYDLGVVDLTEAKRLDKIIDDHWNLYTEINKKGDE